MHLKSVTRRANSVSSGLIEAGWTRKQGTRKYPIKNTGSTVCCVVLYTVAQGVNVLSDLFK